SRPLSPTAGHGITLHNAAQWSPHSGRACRVDPPTGTCGVTAARIAGGEVRAVGTVGAVRVALGRGKGERPPYDSALVGLRIDPHLAAVILHDLLAERQPDPGALVRLGRVQPLEDQEHVVGTLGVDADPVV